MPTRAEHGNGSPTSQLTTPHSSGVFLSPTTEELIPHLAKSLESVGIACLCVFFAKGVCAELLNRCHVRSSSDFDQCLGNWYKFDYKYTFIQIMDPVFRLA